MIAFPPWINLTLFYKDETYKAKTAEKLKLMDWMVECPALCSWEIAGQTSPRRVALNGFQDV